MSLDLDETARILTQSDGGASEISARYMHKKEIAKYEKEIARL
jgi:uncharacterized DUF497 family protein